MNTTMTDRNSSESHATPAMERMRYARRFCRTTALVAVMMLLNAVIWPSWAVAVEVGRQKEAQAQASWEARHQSLEQVLLGIRQEARDGRSMMADTLAEQNQGFLGKARSLFGIEQAPAEALPRLQWLSQRAANLHEQALASFDETEAHLRKKDLPRRILDRNDRAREEYQQAYATMRETLDQALDSGSLEEQEEAMAALVDFMDRFTLDKPRDPFDPNKLPWRTPDPDKTPTPARSAEALSQRTGLPLFEQGLELASLNNNAALSVAPGAPTDEALAATLDAPQTPAMQAKAAELDHDPVRIYQWVRNNIEFIPSYGSIQGAEYTLELGKGNAFDTASLLIALLRASDIPARYAMGTVRIPADQVMNWVGGVNVPSAAGNLMGQGGIPNTGLTRGGQISHFELEHIWVEAWIDFHPSRGADHRTGDTWVPMDASFKQYQYSEGMDLQDQVPFDAEGLARTIEQESTINEEEGWVQGVPGTAIEERLEDYRAELQAYIDNQAPEATVGEVLGTKTIKDVIHQQLTASLPYDLVTRQLTTNELSDSVRWKFRYRLHTSTNGYKGSELLTIEEPTVALAGKSLSLSFSPATQEDEDTLASYLPDADEDGELDPGELPDTLPGHLINLKARFSIGSETVANPEQELAMGSGLASEMGYWQPGRGWDTSENKPIAGEFRALALDLQGISGPAAEKLQTDLETTQAKLEDEEYSGLTKQQLVGDMLYSTILSYFAFNDMQDRINERQMNSVGYRAPSYGLFKTSLQPRYWFGIPRNVTAGGLTMDVDNVLAIQVDKDNDRKRWIARNLAIGARLSAMEHSLPEQMYSTEDNSAHGISAVKALQLATAEGQKIWTITRKNLNQALAALDLGLAEEADIRNAVLAGKEVTAHERPVNFHGRASVGYTVLDPDTGAGAYLIASGENGGDLIDEYLSTLLALVGTLVSEIKAGWAGVAGKALGGLGVLVDFFSNLSSCGWGVSAFIAITMFIYTAMLAIVFSSIFAIFAVGAVMLSIVPAIMASIAGLMFGRMIKESACEG
ncbi:transglutaminase-like domain-containing protein [Alloalcanivorax marinus]|uniref:transglutaminase-like domain-containing protein n=1 Tax=Alloalcanivorax marinus TaxID=1177169 RepID=UPI00193212E0|nr:transglutaminase domain-containing protein [Alloalcanivorax marinus]MBL7251380.1 transglutaminase domain-containing protein [Alloalcanivorax marinus]